jgi:hypothetical protein
MPKIEVKMTESEGWKPLPKGTYEFIIDNVVETLSSKNNPQLKITMHVMNHPQYSDKKSTMFLPMVPKAAFRVSELIDATEIDCDETELTGEQDEDGNDIKFNLSFDTDDLVGATFKADVDAHLYNGKDQQDFNNLRPIKDKERPAAAQQQQQQRSTQPAQGEAAAANNAGAAPGTVRRRRVVNAGA